MKFMFAVAALCVLAVCPAFADDDSQSATGHVDIGTTGGAGQAIIYQYSFAAIRQPSGAVKGQFEFEFVNDGGSARVHGTVDCVTVVGNRARMGGTVRHSSDESVFSVGMHFVWNVSDNGEGRNDPRDTASPMLGLPSAVPPDPFCIAGGFIAELPLRRGNVQVRP